MTPNPTSFNQRNNHPLQSFEWGTFREKLGTKVIRIEGFGGKSQSLSMTVHKIPHIPFFIGYVPKSHALSADELKKIFELAKNENIVFVQLEPDLTIDKIREFEKQIKKSGITIRPSAHPLFTKYTFILDLTKSEEELLKNMHSKTRYNIKVAQKHGVMVREDNSPKAFKEYLKLTDETTRRQQFYAHTPHYHTVLWNTLSHKRTEENKNSLTSHLFTATYKKKILTAWIVFVYKDHLYYPYGASSSEFRNVMASNLMMWEVIKFGKSHGLKFFDMWGALGLDANPKDPWYGFHKFKQGYGPVHTEFVGSYDMIINPALYKIYLGADKVRWKILKLLRK